jgi:hyperosmotically inducible protein
MKNRLGITLLGTTLVGALTLLAACTKPDQTTTTPPPASITVGTEIDDAGLTMAVKTALLADPAVKSFEVKVETRKGEVILSGFVDNQVQLDRANAIANGVAGVKHVVNSLSLNGSTNTVGALVDDIDVTARVKTALLRDDNVKSLDITVVTRKGDAQLSGFVNNQWQIDRAMEVTRGIEGVHAVHNELKIKN